MSLFKLEPPKPWIAPTDPSKHAEEAEKYVLGYRQYVKDAIQSEMTRTDGADVLEHKEFVILYSGPSCVVYIGAHSDAWRNPKHRQQWKNTLTQYAYPVFGNLPVGDIDLPLVLKVLQPIWKIRTETAKRLRGRIEETVRGDTLGFCFLLSFAAIEDLDDTAGFDCLSQCMKMLRVDFWLWPRTCGKPFGFDNVQENDRRFQLYPNGNE